MTRLWYNGIINTMNGKCETAEAIGADDEHIVFIGTTTDALKGTWDEKIDLKGMFLYPGFNDSHLHLVHYALFKQNVPLHDVASIPEMIARCRKYLDEKQPSSLVAVGWNQDNMIDGRLPSRTDLDAVSNEIPVCAVRACLHIAVCNSVMIRKILALSDLTPEEKIDINPDTGIIKENAARVYMIALPAITDEQIEQMVLSAQTDLNACGIVAVQSDDLKSLPGVEPLRLIGILRDLDLQGKLTIRIYEQSLLFGKDFADVYGKRKENDSGSLFRLGPRKILLDGSLGAKTAEMIGGYVGGLRSYKGHANYTETELYDMISEANKAHVDVAIHTIGDLSLKKAIDSIVRSLDENPWPEHRHGVVHAQVTRPELLDKMSKYGIHAMIQPIFIDYDMNIISKCVGEKHSYDAYIWKTMKSKGIHISGGSDCPVEPFNILDNMRAAITRENRDSTKVFLPEEALSNEETIRLFTEAAAWTAREEDKRGHLECGYLADFVIVDRDLLKIPGRDYTRVNVLSTIVNGKTVFNKKEFCYE